MTLSSKSEKINISIGNHLLEQLEKLKYLECIIIEGFTCTTESKARIAVRNSLIR